jgi:N-acetylglutamate synthase-like GNAT family acetyltransferase
MMKLCQYTPANESGCLNIFDSNTPPYFASRERERFVDYLKAVFPPFYYFVVRDDDEAVVACGGMNFDAHERLAKLRWDMVSRDLHHRGVGTFLVRGCLSLICQRPGVQTVSLGTSQYAYRFYEKMGFSTRQINKDRLAPGLDEYLMVLELDEKLRREVDGFGEEKAISWDAI